MMSKSDIIIVGAGPGGYETALLAAEKGKSVTLIESGDLGGTCLNKGCIPTKSLCRSAEIIEELKDAASFGVMSSGVRLDFDQAMARKQAVVTQLRNGVESLLSHRLIRLVRGRASFKSASCVTAASEDYYADDIIIATGSKAFVPDIPGMRLPGVITSDELLSMESLPESICIIGAGVVGLEFASLLCSFGTKVTVLEFCKEVLPRFDEDIARRLRKSLCSRGISIVTQAEVTEVSSGDGALQVRYAQKGRVQSVSVEKVLVAVGRKADLDTMNFRDAGIASGPRGILTDSNMQTNIPHVYAIGDVTGGYMLAHEAVAQGRKALAHICGYESGIRLDIMPSAVFTFPEAASVGVTEQQCKDMGIRYHCRKSFFRANGKAVCMGQTDGMCKIIAEGEGGADGRIIGCHILGPHASDLIQEVSCLMNQEGTEGSLASIVHPHPTLSEIFAG